MSSVTDISGELLTRPAVASDVGVSQRLAAVYELTKPRMNFLVLITTAVGFVAASPALLASTVTFLHTLLGTALTAAGASVLNQFLERGPDSLMPRTRHRPLPAKLLSPAFAMAFGVALGLLGTAYLTVLVSPLSALLAAVTLVSYVAVYTPMKRLTPWCTLVGAVPGAIPPMIGVVAATGEITPLAWALFAVLFVWQMPHFFGLATLYKDDYTRGGFRMLPGEPNGQIRTARQVLFFCSLMIPVSLLPTVGTGIGWGYAAIAVLLGAWFLRAGWRMARLGTRIEARRLFVVSILYLPLLLAALVLDSLIPV